MKKLQKPKERERKELNFRIIMFIQHLFGEIGRERAVQIATKAQTEAPRHLSRQILFGALGLQKHIQTHTHSKTARSSKCIQLHSRQVLVWLILLIIIGIWTHTQFIWESNTHLALSLSPICHELYMAHIVRRECTKKYSSFVELCGCKLSSWCGPSAVWSLW